MSIPRGTTPINYFDVPLDLSTASVVFLTYQQGGKTVLEKEKSDLTFATETDGNDTTYTISVQLAQAETLAFAAKMPVEMQIRARFADGNAVESAIMTTSVDRILKDGVI